MRPRYLLAALALLACTTDSGDGPGDSIDDGMEIGCGGLCGCTHDVTLDFAATVVDAATLDPLAGIDLYCAGEEDAPISTSDDQGVVMFSIETEEQDGCGYLRCNNLIFRDPNGVYEELQVSTYPTNGNTVEMTAVP